MRRLVRVLASPWVDATRFSIEWSRYWLDYAEHACDAVEGRP
jgi:hypothetical protein